MDIDIKINEATKNRPDGTRVLNAPAVLIHINHFVDMVKSENAWGKNDRNGITVFKNEDLTVVLTALKKDARQDDVQTEGYSTLYLVSGKLQIEAGEDQKQAFSSDMLVFHPGIRYSIIAIEECSFFLTHYNKGQSDGKVF